MAAEGDAERLVVLLEARVNDFEKKMSQGAGTAERSYGRMRRSSQSATRQMEADMHRSTTRINQMLASTSTQIGTLGRAFVGGFAGGIFAGGLAGFVTGVKGVVSELATLHKTIERIGMDAKVFQELQFGFKLAGVEAGAFADGIDKFNKNIAVAATQGGKLADILKANGVAIRDQNGNIRSAEALLRDYANLVKNAGSEQEQLLLVTEAFGRGDANFVNALKNGAKGIDDMGQAAEESGGVIDKDLLKKAEDFDDRWDRSWHNFEVNAKSAILTALTWMDKLAGKFAEYEKQKNAADLGSLAGSLAGTKDSGKRDRVGTPDARVRDAFDPALRNALSEADKALILELQKRYGDTAKKAGTTIIPEKPEKAERGSRNKAADQALREAEAVKKLIDNLAHELSLVGASDLEKAKANALRQAGAAATDKQRKQIEALVTALYEETQAQEAASKAQKDFQDGIQQMSSDAVDALGQVIAGTEDAGEAFKRLAIEIVKSAITGKGAYADFFASLSKGGGSGDFLGSLLGGIFGGGGLFGTALNNTTNFTPGLGGGFGGLIGYAKGTDFAPGGPAIVGENGPELVNLPRGAQVIPNNRLGDSGGGGAQNVHVTVGVSVDQNGNLQAYVANVAQEKGAEATARGIKSFVESRGFVDHVAKAANTANQNAMLR